MEWVLQGIIETIAIIIIFAVFTAIGKYLYKKIANNHNRFLNPLEYFPDEELTTLRQVFYLAMILLFFILFIYFTPNSPNEVFLFCILEIILMLYIAIIWDFSSWKSKIFFFLLIPYGSLSQLFFETNFLFLVELIHIPVLLYLMKVYYDKFKEYTETNGLGITIVLLFALIFISFIVTLSVENTSALDSIVMVSNAFTSNGYAVLGDTPLGKFNSLILVWGGYILSGVGTATLTAAILVRQFNKKFEELENLIKENNSNEKKNDNDDTN